jgi:murein DD-endopeptidase MepM/ murein hydrolase activator NlpD
MGLTSHNGLDMVTFKGDSVYAAHDGEVIQAQVSMSAGNSISILSDDLVCTMYFHLQDILVHLGDKVKAGDKIATEGNTGLYTTGTHLHFGLYQFKEPVAGEYSMGFQNGKSYGVVNYNNGYRGAIDSLPYLQTFMEYIIIDNNQYLVYHPMKIAIAIADEIELAKIYGLSGTPTPKTKDYIKDYWDISGVERLRIKNIFNL